MQALSQEEKRRKLREPPDDSDHASVEDKLLLPVRHMWPRMD